MKRVLAIALTVAACGGSTSDTTSTTVVTTDATTTTTTTTTTVPEPVALRGFAISPPDYTAEGFGAFLDRLADAATLLEWVGDAYEWELEGGSPDVTITLAGQAGIEPITIGGWTYTENGALIRPLDDEAIAGYVESARAFAARNRPRFMGFGVEIDTHWREFPDQWEASTELFAEVAAAIHDASPDTKVLVVFQLERVRGLQGGLFGGVNSDDLAAWHLLDDFPDADVIGFTTYPSLVFETPEAMPSDYYGSIREHTTKPVAFTEMGWQAGGDFGAWSGSERNQAAFVERLPDLMATLDPEFVTWSYLYDQPISGTFATMALVTVDGHERQAWHAWLADG